MKHSELKTKNYKHLSFEERIKIETNYEGIYHVYLQRTSRFDKVFIAKTQEKA